MKRIAIIAVTLLLGMSVSARSIRYFTLPQAERTVSYLDRQNELMIYCGYDYEIETYVLVSEVWMERVNSSYYEIWLYGFDAYTGDEVYMPLDLQCVWLMGGGGKMYNAAQYLRFHTSVRVPSMVWYIPPYNPYTRRAHVAGYTYSYHYHIHRHGWMPPAPPAHGWGPHTQPPLPPYYMRTPQTPAPAPTAVWTPGVDHPQVSDRPRNTGSSVSTNRNTGSSNVSTNRSTGNENSSRASSGNVSTTRTTTGTTPTRANTGTSTTRTRDTEGNASRTTETNRDSSTRTSGTTTGTTTRSSGSTTRSSGTTTRSSGTSVRSGSASPAKESTRSTAKSRGTETSSTTTRNRTSR